MEYKFMNIYVQVKINFSEIYILIKLIYFKFTNKDPCTSNNYYDKNTYSC